MSILKRIYNRFFSKKTSTELELEYLQSKGMQIGKNVNCFSADSFDHIYPHLISIGDNTTISSSVMILAHDASPNVVGCGTKVGRVKIGSNVFVGGGSTILCDVTIGDNVIIGASSVVSKDLPSNAVYAGVPARRICSIEEYKAKYEALRQERADLSKIMPWYEWPNASMEKKQEMREIVEEDFAFI